jgi:NAD(P)-dependent dehydrogenase (short-subunit alcohol dehydrogenase family)
MTEKMNRTGYMLSYCRRWGERGVRAYTVHPGFVRSGMLSKAAVSTPVRILFTLLSYILGRSEAQVPC